MGCNNCSGCSDCGGCSGCGASLEITPQELEFLRELAQMAFLPVARKMGEDVPIFPGADKTLVLQLLEKKGLRFAIREGGRTVGSGVVTEIYE